MNVWHLLFNQMGDLLLFTIKFIINELYMVNILYFLEVAKISVVHINMATHK